jgi:hypothetical protein
MIFKRFAGESTDEPTASDERRPLRDEYQDLLGKLQSLRRELSITNALHGELPGVVSMMQRFEVHERRFRSWGEQLRREGIAID